MLIELADVEGGVRIITLKNPPANALNCELLGDLSSAMDDVIADDAVRALIVRGSERFFCAGLDLAELATGEADALVSIGYDDGVYKLWTCPKPTVAQVQGHAIAGGAVIALACDARIASVGRQRIGLNENAFGIPLPREVFEAVRMAIPAHNLGRVILEGALYTPEEALTQGMVHELVEPAVLADRCLSLAQQLAAYRPSAYAHNKALVQEPAVARCRAETEEARAKVRGLWMAPETLRCIQERLGSIGSRG